MVEKSSLINRKTDHIRINLEEDVESGLKTGLDELRFVHQALPDVDFERIDMGQVIFGKQLKIPLLISSMTGGTADAAKINRTLAEAAQEKRVAMGLGSQRAAIEKSETSSTFKIRYYAPDILLFANLGAVQLNYGFGVAECQRAVEMIAADALILHLNPLQEVLQPEGETRFAGLIGKIEQVCKSLACPVIVKEVGWGISETVARQLANAGVAAIDVAGAGGTSWSQVEMHRAETPEQAHIAASFRDWGLTTVESITQVKAGAPGMMLIASGGLRNGIDLGKSLALGASMGGMAAPFLKTARKTTGETVNKIEMIARELQICMFAAGVRDIQGLRKVPLLRG